MANTIGLISQYGAENLDEVFVRESCTGILENQGGLKLRPAAQNAKIVYIPDMVLSGLGDYSRSGGFPDGDIDITWTPYTCTKDRGRSFTLDSQDDAETAGVTAANVMQIFMKEKVIPEVDAYRFSILADKAATKATTQVAVDNIISCFGAAEKQLVDDEVGLENVVYFISTEVDLLIKTSTQLSRLVGVTNISSGGIDLRVKTFNGIPLIVVPRTRFKTAFTFGADGFSVADGSQDIDFMLVHFNSALPYKKHEKIRVFAPDINQDKDAWKFQYRIYHDIFVTKNKTKGIYINKKAPLKTLTFDVTKPTAASAVSVVGSMAAIDISAGYKYILPKFTPTLEGYHFAGWSTAATLTADEDTVVNWIDNDPNFVMPADAETLYAIWLADAVA